MRKALIAFASLAIAFLAIDSIWLGVIAVDFYKATIGHLLAPKPDFVAAAFFYVIYLAGVVHFVVLPAASTGRVAVAARQGALFGLVAYATYDLTNMATMRDWPLSVTLADLAWGAFITATSSAISAWIVRRFG
ncbi:DUF2177 family protein [Rhizobium sp. C1]|uniref:DUF2177 family protein n=1 Tax=Rhizobium sp. C1 TaxID=1349799 RepID=UPI001E3841F3|nr:DUF2177 family protein [Rhizobium sp. C1]MCD2177988.1 DUF2177 family protein [Rhizobium sp. C1]